MEQTQRGLAAIEKNALSDLYLEPVGYQPAIGQRVKDGFAEQPAMKLHGRDVNGDANMVGPSHGLRAGFADDPRTNGKNEAGVLGHGNEFVWRHHATLRMPPAQQGLERADPILLQVEQVLIDEFELASLQRQPQVGLKLAPLLGALIE